MQMIWGLPWFRKPLKLDESTREEDTKSERRRVTRLWKSWDQSYGSPFECQFQEIGASEGPAILDVWQSPGLPNT